LGIHIVKVYQTCKPEAVSLWEEAARLIIRVDPKQTSQTCSGCGAVRKKELSERWHSCACGAELHRDHNAALNILGRASPASA
jgi:transposase